MVDIKQTTSGLLLKEFIAGYTDHPFGEQGLVISKQLLDMAFPGVALKEIIKSDELIEMLLEEEAQYEFKKNPFFHAFVSFIGEKTPATIKNMSGNQLKEELAGLVSRKRPLPTFEIDRKVYDLSGNPETASHAKKSLENALIETMSSLFSYLLIGEGGLVGKFFLDLLTIIEEIAVYIEEISYIQTFIRYLTNFKWRSVNLNGCIPTLQQLETNNLYIYLKSNPEMYISFLKENLVKKLKEELGETLLTYIDEKWELLKANEKTNLEINIDYPNHEDLTKKVQNGLKKLLSKVQANKKISEQDYHNLINIVQKEIAKREERIVKEIQNFEKSWGALKIPEPPWLKFTQTATNWQIYDPELTKNEISDIFKLKNLFPTKNKADKQIYSIFKEMGGMDFVIKTIISHHFYDQLPPEVSSLIKTPAKYDKNQAHIFLREKQHQEGIDSLREFLLDKTGAFSKLLAQGLAVIKKNYFKKNPEVLMDEEHLQNPSYLPLFDLGRELFEEIPPEKFFGNKYFLFLTSANNVNVGFHLSEWKGKGNDLFEIIVSSSALENAYLYRQATKILGHFSGYVYSAAVGNLRICPPELVRISDLFT